MPPSPRRMLIQSRLVFELKLRGRPTISPWSFTGRPMTHVGRHHGDSPCTQRGRGILVVTADADAAERMTAELRPLDVQVGVLPDLASLRTHLERGAAPDVLLLDEELPDGSGVEFCDHLRSAASWSSVYVVLLAAEETQADPGGRGADDHLPRPWEPGALRMQVRAGLRVQAHRRVTTRRERRRAIEWLGTVVAHELNNPLAVAMCNLQAIDAMVAGEVTPSDLAELRDMARDALDVLKRMHRATRLFAGRRARRGTTVDAVSPTMLQQRLQTLLAPLGRALEVRVDGVQGTVHCEVDLLLEALGRLAREATAWCEGRIDVAVHTDHARTALLVEFGDAPETDPDTILEPHLRTSEKGTVRYDPGLSDIEAIFTDAGGQIFARPAVSRWRFGLTLPVSRALS